MDRDGTVKVWDPALRLFHWSLVAAFATAYVSREQHYVLHLQSGYAVLALLAFRVAWGMAGGRHARFASFAFGPVTVVRYLGDMARGTARRHLGHNPAAAAMIAALLITLLVIAVSGVALDAAENRAGPLAALPLYRHLDLIGDVHEIASHACVVLVMVHVAGVAVSSWQHRENLVRAMITGRKRAGPHG